MRCIFLSPDDAGRLLSFYNRLSPEVTELYQPFPVVSREVMSTHLEETAASKHISAALEENGEICGHSFILNLRDQHPVFGIGIEGRHHGAGWGRTLMKTVLERAVKDGITTISLTVLKHNLRAQALYKSFGFEVVSDHTFRDENDSYFMLRNTNPE